MTATDYDRQIDLARMLHTGEPAVTIVGDVVTAAHLIPRHTVEDPIAQAYAREEAQAAVATEADALGRELGDDRTESWLWLARVESVPDAGGRMLVRLTQETAGSPTWTHALFTVGVRLAPRPPQPIRAFWAPLGAPLPTSFDGALDGAFTEIGWIAGDGLTVDLPRPADAPAETLRTLKTSAAFTMDVTWTSPRTAALYRLLGLPVPYGLSRRRARMTQRQVLSRMRSAYGRRAR